MIVVRMNLALEAISDKFYGVLCPMTLNLVIGMRTARQCKLQATVHTEILHGSLKTRMKLRIGACRSNVYGGRR